jgi:hypothetical protein
MSDKTRCKFFIWDTDAHPREAAALSNNSRTEPPRPEPDTPTRRQPSPPPPYTIESEPSRKRSRAAVESDDEFDLDNVGEAFENELDHVMTAIETPRKATRTSDITTPSTRRKLPWQMDRPSTATVNGLPTPQTGGRTANDLFAARLSAQGTVTPFTPSKDVDQHDGTHQAVVSSSAFGTPTPNRYRNFIADDTLAQDVFSLFEADGVRLPAMTESKLKDILSKHTNMARQYKRGRDVSRDTITDKDKTIGRLTVEIGTLQAQLAEEKAMADLLRE